MPKTVRDSTDLELGCFDISDPSFIALTEQHALVEMCNIIGLQFAEKVCCVYFVFMVTVPANSDSDFISSTTNSQASVSHSSKSFSTYAISNAYRYLNNQVHWMQSCRPHDPFCLTWPNNNKTSLPAQNYFQPICSRFSNNINLRVTLITQLWRRFSKNCSNLPHW